MTRPARLSSQNTGWFRIGAFGQCRYGSMGTVLAVSLPAILGLIGVALDYASFSTQRTELQKAADAAAIAAAKELTITAPNLVRIAAIAESVVGTHVKLEDGESKIVVKAEVVDNNRAVRITLDQRKTAIMSKIVTPALTDVSVSAVASLSGSQKVCIIALEPKELGAIALENASKVTARDCGIFSNSHSRIGVMALGTSVVTAPTVCSSGGYSGNSGNFITPRRLTDCPPKADPLEDRPPPVVGPCSSKQRLVIKKTQTLTPGVYCGGVEVATGANVNLAPGIYIFRNGPLTVSEGASLTGTNVGLHFTGFFAALDFRSGSIIKLTAPKSGPMAGILIYGDPKAEISRLYMISSDDVKVLVGTVYIPRGILLVDSTSSVSEDSPWTAIVAQRLVLRRTTNLILRTDYGLTDVPIPAGLSPVGNVRLIQ